MVFPFVHYFSFPTNTKTVFFLSHTQTSNRHFSAGCVDFSMGIICTCYVYTTFCLFSPYRHFHPLHTSSILCCNSHLPVWTISNNIKYVEHLTNINTVATVAICSHRTQISRFSSSHMARIRPLNQSILVYNNSNRFCILYLFFVLQIAFEWFFFIFYCTLCFVCTNTRW